jgi:hypothetical protein
MEVKETDEQAFERYLQGSGPLSRAYRELGEERPSPAIDQAVLAAARSVSGAQIPRPARPWRWTTMAALAATVLLSFGIVMRLALEPQAQQARQEPASSAEKKRDDASELKDSARSSENVSHLAPSEAKKGAPAALPANAPASDASAVTGALEAASGSKEERLRSRSEQDEGLMRSVPRSKAGGARHEGAAAERATTAPSAFDSAAPATSPAEPTAATPAPEAYATAPAMSPAPAKMLQKTVKRPEEWLDEIARLRAKGEEEAAEREYAEFRKAYPDYVQTNDTPEH